MKTDVQSMDMQCSTVKRMNAPAYQTFSLSMTSDGENTPTKRRKRTARTILVREQSERAEKCRFPLSFL